MTDKYVFGFLKAFRYINDNRITSLSRTVKWFSTICICTACGLSEQAITPSLPPSQLLARLQLNEHAYNLAIAAPYDTVQLKATGYSGTGEVIDAKVEYSIALAAQDKMMITPAGLLSVSTSGTDMIVRAQMTYNGVTLTDSAFVNVFASAPMYPIEHVGFMLQQGDSAITAVGSSHQATHIIGTDSRDSNVPSLSVRFWLSDSSIASPSDPKSKTGATITVAGRRVGKVMLYTSTYAFGVILKDSLEFQIGWPVIPGNVLATPRFDPKSTKWVMDFDQKRVIVGVGACVTWRNTQFDLPIDVKFDDPSAVGPSSTPITVRSATGGENPINGRCMSWGSFDLNNGNIEPFKYEKNENGRNVTNSQYRVRTFPRAGVYRFYSTLYNTEGTIIVCDNQGSNPDCDPDKYLWFLL